MQKFFSNRRLVITVVILVACFGLMGGSVAMRNRRSTPPLIQQFGNDIVGFADDIVAYPVNAVQSGVSSVSELMNAYTENRELKQKVSELAQVKVRDQTLAKENKELKAELKLKSSLTDYSTVSAAVMSRTPSSWQQQLVINKGQTSGIKKNMPVLSGGGLIGRVSEVNKTNSKVELLSDTSESSNRFSIVINGSDGKNVNGIITGYNARTNELIMGQVTSTAKIKKGAKVMTNGMGGITPKGLYVGKVSRIGKDDYGLAKKVYIKPATNFNEINIVTVAELND
ncbi:rod shape-determining protein MreC [Limosilactobacillus mucosae]|uniref:Cell shape-determining protein MreC n=1 Tax=Limosilactobacillus mucosae TaxID=97478 RepID=A0AAJ1MAA0_LIMMU|nr:MULTISPECIES: rod shape-determining protein MreC [Lactobacillaceae]MDD6454061.1 rod shape-determining protein MreC [Lactobacillus sp.]MDC2829465.1 rod shape-determining protein MreC [Limosilactobacillus mucosae]MDC2837148.1 rod shape-determining protein MreC [Limosilactobacillus mucosae]MDC2838861.1 rod shape-determining protein MreC [Limosilactobacillus mucosae]MDC2845819.1 rod shape-determining protein MreC [Limosilactobacillus mucosae]